MRVPKKIRKIISKARETKSNILDLSRQGLTEIPSQVFQLTNLTKLNLSSNQLTEISGSITNLYNLTELNLSSNQLKTVPKSISNLSTLTHLYLSSNQIKIVPESISNLSNLIKLNLSSNQIIKISDSIGNLSKLTWLNLNSNQLKTIPKSISNLLNLNDLYLKNNPIEIPPIEIVNKGVQGIREYFRQLEEGEEDHFHEEDYLYEAKLLILGEGGVGKTTLAKKIQNPDYKLQLEEKSTEGIDVIEWSFNLENKREFNVHIWDFGGQEIYHATHEFFLTKRSLYVLVVENRKEDDNLEYWLKVVELLSENSPLLIIKNEKQDRKREINERALRGEFTNLKETLATNLAENRGLDGIIDQIKHYISHLEHIGTALPKTWKQVRKALEQDLRNHISLDEYLKICEQNGFTQLKDKLQLSGYLHDLGVCLHFQDEEDSLLYKTVILKPEWGTDAVYKVLDNPKVIKQQGSFNRQDLKKIWQEDKYSSMRGELLELMKKFQLCYEIPECKSTFIAPQLLPENQPEYKWDKSNNLILRYAYPTFMPKGIVTRFIVVMHEYIDQQQHVWKKGVILEKYNTRAEIIENSGQREIKIRVFGSNKRDLMTIITHEIDKINKSYKRLEYKKLIPCNCKTCADSQKPHGYDYQQLRKRINFGKDKIECDKSLHMVNILSLIDHSFINNPLEEEKANLKEREDPIPQMNIRGDNNQIIIKSDNQENITSDSSPNKQVITLEEGNYNENIEGNYSQQTGNNNQISTGTQSSANPEQNNQPSRQKFDKDFILRLVSILLVILGIIIFNKHVQPWLDSVFSSPTPELQQEEKENN